MTEPFQFADFEAEDASAGSARRRGAAGEAKEVPAGGRGDPSGFPPLSFETRRAAKKKVEPVFSAKELEAALEEARRDAELQVRMAFTAEAENRQAEAAARQADALQAIRAQLEAEAGTSDRWMAEAGALAQQLTRMMGRALAPKALELEPLADIVDMVRQVLSRLAHQPTIEIRLNPELAEQAGQSLKAAADEAGFAGNLTITPDSAFKAGDARVLWKGGAAERDLDRIRKEAEAIIDAWFDTGPLQSSSEDPSQDEPTLPNATVLPAAADDQTGRHSVEERETT